MSKEVRIRRGDQATNDNYTGPAGELTVDTTNWNIRLHDGSTFGGNVLESSRFLDDRYLNVTGDTMEGPLEVDSTADFYDVVTFHSNVVVEGTSFEVDSQVTTTDRVLVVNDGEVGDGVTGGNGFAGFEIDRGTLTNYFFGFKEDEDSFVLGTENNLERTATEQYATNEAIRFAIALG